MLSQDLITHASEFKSYLNQHKYELAPGGIYFPAAKVQAVGRYTHSVNGQDQRTDCNLVTDQGMNHMLSVALAGGAQQLTWYLALFSGAYTPVAGLTAATFTSAATEITSAVQGYTETLRPVWTPVLQSLDTKIDNVASQAAFTIASATSLVIRGAALLSDPIKGGVSGVLMSASRFSADRVQFAGDVFNLAYEVDLVPV